MYWPLNLDNGQILCNWVGKNGFYGMVKRWIVNGRIFWKIWRMDPLWALDDLLGDHSNFIGLFQTLTYVKLKKSIDYFQSTLALSQITRTHFGPKITFLATTAFNILLFGILSTAKYQATIVTCYHVDTQDIWAMWELYLLWHWKSFFDPTQDMPNFRNFWHKS